MDFLSRAFSVSAPSKVYRRQDRKPTKRKSLSSRVVDGSLSERPVTNVSHERLTTKCLFNAVESCQNIETRPTDPCDPSSIIDKLDPWTIGISALKPYVWVQSILNQLNWRERIVFDKSFFLRDQDIEVIITLCGRILKRYLWSTLQKILQGKQKSCVPMNCHAVKHSIFKP